MNKQTADIGQGKPGPGRPKGSVNKTTRALKEAILLAAEQHGLDGEGKDGLTGYLRKLASDDMKAFSSLLGRVLPLQVDASVRPTISAEPMSAEEWAERYAGDGIGDLSNEA